jgi:hypothetical protein
MARVESASWAIGRERRRAKSRPSISAPARLAALQTIVSRTMRSTEAKAMSRSRSTSTPQGGSPTGAIDARTAPAGVFSERVRRAGKRTKSATRVEGWLARAPEVAGGNRIRPERSTSVARASRRASSWNSRTIGCQDTRASTTPIRVPRSSVTGAATTATAPSSSTAKGSLSYRTPSRADSKPFRNSKSSSGDWTSGPTKLPRPWRFTPRSATSSFCPLRAAPRTSGPSAAPKGSRWVSCEASRTPSAARVNCRFAAE